MKVRFEWVFSDPCTIIHEDRVVEGEERLQAIGFASEVVPRIVSVRKAIASERRLDEEGE